MVPQRIDSQCFDLQSRCTVHGMHCLEARRILPVFVRIEARLLRAYWQTDRFSNKQTFQVCTVTCSSGSRSRR